MDQESSRFATETEPMEQRRPMGVQASALVLVLEHC